MDFLTTMFYSLFTFIVGSALFEGLKAYREKHQLPWGSIVNWLIKIAIVVTFFYADNVGWSKNRHLLLAFLLAFTCWIPFVLSKEPITRLEIIGDIVCPIVTIILANIDLTVKVSV